jgi:hypothetical protein
MKPGLYWLVEIVEPGYNTLYLRIPPRIGYPCGFTFIADEAKRYKSKWHAKFIAWLLTHRGIRCRAAEHIWLDQWIT